MNIAVASGKGGTGKTTVSLNLAKTIGSNVQLLDCDVEEPNAHLFLNGRTIQSEIVNIRIPQVDESLCDGCGECSSFCEYHAIISFESTALVFPEMCHGCGGCTLVCPQRAITEVDKRIGIIETIEDGAITLIQGRMDIGVVMAPPLIRAVKSHIRENGLAILDAPPGTSCPVITTLTDADVVILVTEPTPFGLHDLRLAVETVQELGIPFGVVINRADSGDDRVRAFCAEENIPILIEIPDERDIAIAYSRGELIVDALPEYRGLFLELFERTKRLYHASSASLSGSSDPSQMMSRKRSSGAWS